MGILNQPNKIPQAVISNGLVTGNQVQNPQNLLNTTDDTAIFGATSDVIIGSFPFSLPLDAVIVGISGIMKARIDNSSIPAGAVTPTLVDSTGGSNLYYPGAPVTGLSNVLQEYSFGGDFDIWGNIAWTPTKLNNIKLQLTANSAIEVAWATLTVFYYIPQTSLIPAPFTLPGCADCDSTIQALPFELAQPWLSNQTKLYLKSFNLPDEDPITLAMLGACGGTINLTVDPDLRKEDGGNFIENFNLDDQLATITLLPSGLVELDIGALTQRGLGFDTPYGHNSANISEHAAGAVVIITNNGPWNSKLLKRCHIGNLVGAPLEVQDEGSTVAVAVDKMNFIGPNVQAEQDAGDPRKANVTIIADPTNVDPTQENTATGTNNTTPSLTLTVPLTITSANYLRVKVITEDEVITGVTYDGVAMTLIGEQVNPGVNLKVAIFGLINPNVGTHDAVVTMPTPRIITSIATGWKDVDTTSPVDGVSSGNIGSDNTPTDSVTTTTDNTVMDDVVGTTNNPTTFTQYGLWSIDGAVTTGIRPGASSSRRVLAPQSVTDIYTLSLSTGWAILMAGIRGISNPANGVQSVTGLDTDNTDPLNPIVKIAVDGTTITGDGTPGNPLVAVGGSASGTSLETTVTQVAHGLAVGDIIKSNGTDNQFDKAQADNAVNSETVGIVTDVVDADHFKYVSSAIQLSGAFVPVGTPGSAVFLDPSVAGGLTTTKPTAVGQIIRALGTIIASGATMYFDIAALAVEITSSSASGGVKFGGDGSDGALAVSSGLTTIDLAGARVVVKNYTSVSITGTGAVNFINPHANGSVVIIKSQGNVTLTSSATPMLDMSGCGAAGGASVTRSSAGVATGNNGTVGSPSYTYWITNAGIGSTGGSGAAGGAAISSTLAYKILDTINATKYPFTFVGAGGGSGAATFTSGNDGGNPTSGAGGRGGGGLVIECGGAWNFTTANGISVAGSIGGNGSLPSGGVNRRLAGSGGGGGGGGYFIALYNSLTANTGSINTSGGAGGLGVGDDSGGAASFAGGAGAGAGLLGGGSGVNGGTGVAGDGGIGGIGLSFIQENTDFA